MIKTKQFKAGILTGILALAAVSATHLYAGEHEGGREERHIRHVLLISIDGMHELDFANCAKGISGVNAGLPYCPQLAKLSHRGVNYLQASSSKPSDSFPGLLALVTGGSPRSTGVFYDVSYDRSLSPPAQTTPGDIAGGACPSNGKARPQNKISPNKMRRRISRVISAQIPDMTSSPFCQTIELF